MSEPNFRVKAFVAGLVAEAIREVVPTDSELAAAELLLPENRRQVMQELERLTNHYMAEAIRLESL